ncbi:hypothetical protein ACIQU6_40045 [Streptomyces sp. NPDC090442]|uniref:hypothetical protein n=1 Tax=Streptomyces sp. NPDC090442 TaxID=3365962 RepID=UPI00380DD1AF
MEPTAIDPAEAATNPDAVRGAWRHGEAAEIPTGQRWLAAQLPLDLGMIAMAWLTARKRHVGSLMVSVLETSAWWLVPLGSTDELEGLEYITVHGQGATLTVPPPDAPQAATRTWLVPPSEGLTDPQDLRAAVTSISGQYRVPTPTRTLT